MEQVVLYPLLSLLFIARGLDLADAIAAAKNYLSQALEAGKDIHIGEGHGPVNYLFNPEKLITL